MLKVIIVAGAAVFAELMNHGVSGFRYSPLGLRDGLLAQMAADYGHGAQARRQIESERWNALLAAGKHYGADLRFSARVRNLALELFAGLRKVHRLPPTRCGASCSSGRPECCSRIWARLTQPVSPHLRIHCKVRRAASGPGTLHAPPRLLRLLQARGAWNFSQP